MRGAVGMIILTTMIIMIMPPSPFTSEVLMRASEPYRAAVASNKTKRVMQVGNALGCAPNWGSPYSEINSQHLTW